MILGTNKPFRKNKGSLVSSTFKIEITIVPLILDFSLVVGIKNWDLSQMLFGQQLPKATNVQNKISLSYRSAFLLSFSLKWWY